MYSGISGMRVNQNKLDVIGNNIANVGTTSFKSSQARFKDMLYQNAGEATAPTSAKGGTNAKQVGLGAQLSSINKMMGQGNALSTGRSLDVCVDGDGYFMVGKGVADYAGTGTTLTTDHKIAGGDMEILYTRDGNLTLDKDGNLLTADGYRVMGYLVKGDADEDDTTVKSAATSLSAKGDALYVNADGIGKTSKKSAVRVTGDVLQPLKIPDSVKKAVAASGKIPAATDTTTTTQPVKKFEIGSDGLITAVLGDGSRTVLGQIAMASFKNPEGLVSVGGNYLNVSSNSGEPIVRSGVNVKMNTDGTLNPAIDDNSKGYGDCIQGALEGSNVDLTEQFTDMITATRSFQAASKMITTGDEILQTITGLMR
jgi:flagellar hook protein FlgE